MRRRHLDVAFQQRDPFSRTCGIAGARQFLRLYLLTRDLTLRFDRGLLFNARLQSRDL